MRLTRYATIDRQRGVVTHTKNLTHGSQSTNRFPPDKYDIEIVGDEVHPGWVRENGKLLPPLRDRDPEPRPKAA